MQAIISNDLTHCTFTRESSWLPDQSSWPVCGSVTLKLALSVNLEKKEENSYDLTKRCHKRKVEAEVNVLDFRGICFLVLFQCLSTCNYYIMVHWHLYGQGVVLFKWFCRLLRWRIMDTSMGPAVTDVSEDTAINLESSRTSTLSDDA